MREQRKRLVGVVTSDKMDKTVIVEAVSYTHLRAHETVLDIVCRLLLEKKKQEHPCKQERPLTTKQQQTAKYRSHYIEIHR